MNDVVSRMRFRKPGQPWGPWFVFRSIIREPEPPCRPGCPLCRVHTGEPEIVRNMVTVPLKAWRTNHRYRCRKCKHEFLGGPGSLSGHEGCPKCGHVYWVWETWEVKDD